MKGLTIFLSLLLVAAIAGAAFFYQTNVAPIRSEYERMQIENKNLGKQIFDLNRTLNEKVTELSKAKIEKEEEIADVEAAKDSLINKMQNEINDNQIIITQLADQLNVRIVDKILFASGQSEITEKGLEVMERVGNILKTMKDKTIRVEGHTDNVPIHSRLKEKFPTNWELSNARATNVVRFLEETIQIDPIRLEAVGLGEHHPVADNETKEGRAQNRRIEIKLMPLPQRTN